MTTLGCARLGSAIGVGTSITRASGTATFNAALAAGDSITIGGQLYEWIEVGPYGPGSMLFIAGQPPEQYAAQLIYAVNTGIFGGSPNASVYATISGAVVTLWSRVSGADGNSITLTKAAANITLSGATLSGG